MSASDDTSLCPTNVLLKQKGVARVAPADVMLSLTAEILCQRGYKVFGADGHFLSLYSKPHTADVFCNVLTGTWATLPYCVKKTEDEIRIEEFRNLLWVFMSSTFFGIMIICFLATCCCTIKTRRLNYGGMKASTDTRPETDEESAEPLTPPQEVEYEEELVPETSDRDVKGMGKKRGGSRKGNKGSGKKGSTTASKENKKSTDGAQGSDRTRGQRSSSAKKSEPSNKIGNKKKSLPKKESEPRKDGESRRKSQSRKESLP